MVTDNEGNVLGISTTGGSSLILVQGMYSLLIARADISSELLQPGGPVDVWTRGPSLTMVGWPSPNSGSGGGSATGIHGVGILTSASDYDRMTLALEDLTASLGSPVPARDLDLNRSDWYFQIEGFMLVAVYPRPVELKSVEGNVVASAKWIGIQWGRDGGQPNRLVYGASPFTIDGGYEILGDISQLTESVPPMATESQSTEQLVEAVSVQDTYRTGQTVNPGGPMIEVTLKNVSSEPVISLNATLKETGDRSFDFVFDVAPENPQLPGQTVSSQRILIGGGWGGGITYSLAVNGTLQNGQTFSFTWEPEK